MEVAIAADGGCKRSGHAFYVPASGACNRQLRPHAFCRGPLNLSPWLYVVPLELQPFRSFLAALGVPPSFSAEQYVHVLSLMAEQHGNAPLPPHQLEQAIAAASAVAGAQQKLLGTIYVPDSRAILKGAGGVANMLPKHWNVAFLP